MAWISTLKILSGILLVTAIGSGVNGECGVILNDPGMTFAFVEVKENIEVGSLLAAYPTSNVTSGIIDNTTICSNYIDLNFNEKDHQIEFYLKRPLSDYREEVWAPSIETAFNVSCSSGKKRTKMFTFMVIIEDANIRPPIFQRPFHDFNVTFPWPIDAPMNNIPIKIIDKDFNRQFATVHVSCEGSDCGYFRIENRLISDSDGHNYEVNVYFKDEIDYSEIPDFKEGYVFSLKITANDSMYTNQTEVNFLATRVAMGSVEQSELPIGAIAGGSSAGILVLLILLGGLVYTKRQNNINKETLRKLTETEIREFLDGVTGFGGATPKRSIDVNTPVLAMPYNKAFEISRDKLRIDETTILGTGFFGIVMKGSVTHQNGDSITVAVKAVKRNVGVLYFKALLSELKIMSFIGKHTNIVSLIGACTHNIRKREVFIAVEYCSNGNLHNFLRINRLNFLNLVRDGKLCGFANAVGSYAYSRRNSASQPISTLDLVKWSMQVSHGMEYLSSIGIIHGDLATRNILLDTQKVAKIADFGLSRRLVDVSNYYYEKQTQAPLPWKWMAPESLKDMKFSKKSDIWSFGIVLWEIFTLGQTPYAGLNWDEQFVHRLEKGLRLLQPEFSTDAIYFIMKDCWTNNPHDRPAIFDIKRDLEAMASALLLQSSDEGYFRVLGGEKHVDLGDYHLNYSESNYQPGIENGQDNIGVNC